MKKITLNETTKKVIKIALIVLLAVGICGSMFVGGYYLNKQLTAEYDIKVTVVEVIEDRHEVYFETETGHIFYITTDEVFANFEEYTITFNSMGTPNFEDDIIIKVTREIIVLAE